MSNALKRFIEKTKAALISDKTYISRKYERTVGRQIDWENPRTFTEKIQWLKLHWRPAVLTQCADKFAVREFVAERTGPELLKQVHGVYERVEDIDPDRLPPSFVLKVNRGCKQNIFCADKSRFDWGQCRKLLREYLATNHYYPGREWAYKNIPPRILCEEHLTPNGEEIREYDFYCFNGTPRAVEVIHGFRGVRRANMFDPDLEPLPRKYDAPPLQELPQKTENYFKMQEYAARLCQGFPFVRVDLFEVDGRICFGEMTFYPLGGMLLFSPPEFDDYLGAFLELPAPLPAV